MDNLLSQHIFSKIISDQLLKPQIEGVYLKTFEPGFRMDSHSHNTVEVISVVHGYSYMMINGQYIKIRKNESLIIFPNISHSFFLDTNCRCRL